MVGFYASAGGGADQDCVEARAVEAGTKIFGVGGLYPSDPCGWTALKCRRQLSMTIFGSARL